jgi:SAM-dependent methyltransferase
MTPQQLLHQLDNLLSEELGVYLEDNANELNFCFLNAIPTLETNRIFERMISSIAQKQLPSNLNNSLGIQLVYTHLAFYFKRINKRDFVDTCATHIQDNAFKKRLSAWLHYKRYTQHKSHLSEFEHYLEKLSAALFDETDEFYYEILSDLQEYRIHGLKKLNPAQKAQMEVLFNDPILQNRFPLLSDLTLNPNLFLPGVEINNNELGILLPTISVQKVFEDNFLKPLQGKNLYGYTFNEARNIINMGQADFDERHEHLTSVEIVKLYCFINMRMHYFSSWSLYERSALIKYYSTNGRIKFIDIGCGPGTSGLAFATYITEKTGQPAIFDYIGIDTAITMQQEAVNILTNDFFIGEGHITFADGINKINLDNLSNPSCIIINACYVFASPSLEVEPIADFIRMIQHQFKYCPKYLVYQNLSDKDFNLWANQKYIDFKLLLDSFNLEYSGNQKVSYYNQRNMIGNSKNIEVFFEILKL